jgi:hypothetical protein
MRKALVRCALWGLAAGSFLSVCHGLDNGSGPLGQIAGEMSRAESLLRQGAPAGEVRGAQEEVVRQLDALIGRLEIQSGGAAASAEPGQVELPSPAGSTGVPFKPAEQSVLPPGGPPPGALNLPGESGAPWLPQLPEKDRQAVAEAFSAGRLPPRYRELLRSYNRRLAEGEQSSAPAAP